MKNLRMKLELDLTVTPDYRVIVNTAKTIPVLEGQTIVVEIGKVTRSTFKYGVISFPVKSELADLLIPGSKIKAKFSDFLIPINIGEKKGRITGLSNLINKKKFQDEFNVDDDVELHFDAGTGIIELKKPSESARNQMQKKGD